ncbi:MAG: radical SAM protein [Nitrososphaerales archaeon]|jgi:radical SAM superfamily enzyme YgiQ (UPF0313 family)
MARVVLVSDTTLNRQYSNFPLLDFLPCAPSGKVPRVVWEFLKGKPPPAIGGRASVAPYALRKLESALLTQHKPEEIVVAHEDYLEDVVRDDTEVVGVYTMDPLGLGPLTIGFSVLFSDASKPWVMLEFESLMARLNRARAGKKTKLVVGGPGVWELTVLPEQMEALGIDLAFQGEADDIANELFEDFSTGAIYGSEYFQGFSSFGNDCRRNWVSHSKFVTRRLGGKQFPNLDEIPLIRAPTVKGFVEVMRGCGIGCDFCEVTLRPLRYYTTEMAKSEVAVNAAAGQVNAWVHSDEIFAYKHEAHFVPNQDAIKELFKAIMSVDGLVSANPTHGRVSVPAAFPELPQAISRIVRAGPDRWVGIQSGLETGSERLATIHMPNKTLPLKIGPDGEWQEIVLKGLVNLNKAYWRPAFTVQVGQMEETPEDNWETVKLVNRMGALQVDGRPAEFTITPMQNMPLGTIKSTVVNYKMLDASQLAVYYACYLHLMRITARNALKDSSGNPLKRVLVATALGLGSWRLLGLIEDICKKRGVDLEKVKRYGLEQQESIRVNAS